MVKHVIIWKFRDELANKPKCAQEIKLALEGLVGKIDSLVEIQEGLGGELPSFKKCAKRVGGYPC